MISHPEVHTASKPLEFGNLNVEQNEKIQSLVSRYKKFNPNTNLSGPDKKRMEVREKFFEYAIYGLVEMEAISNDLSEEERKIVFQQDAYEVARKLSVEIESNLFNVNNKQNKFALTENYKQRCKLLFANMRDVLNLHLRRRILNKSLKPVSLCTISEYELLNPTKIREMEEQKIKLLNRDTINLSD